MIEKKYYQLALSLFILLFIAMKWSSLSLPYFWDEAWSYIPAISEMAKNNPGLLPGSITPDLTRGHPMLFYFLASIWMKTVGGSLFSMHSFALIIAILAILSFYRLLQHFVSIQWSFLGVILLLVQEAFFVQSSFVLPEVLLMLLTTEAIRNYVNMKKISFLVCAGLIVLTKETGLVIVLAFILFDIYLNKGIKKSSRWMYLSLLPAIMFYSLQKILLGWFFYPLHLGLIDISTDMVLSKMNIILRFLFYDQGRKFILVLLICLLAAECFFQKRKQFYFLVPVMLLLLIYLLFSWNSYILLALLGISIFQIVHLFAFPSCEKKMLNLSLWLFVITFIFSILNFLMLRYLLFLFPVLILALVFFLQKSIPEKFIYSTGMVILCSSFFLVSLNYDNHFKKWHDDVSANYTHMVKVHREVISYCEGRNWYDKKIFTHFLLQQDFINPELGYCSASFKNVRFEGGLMPDDDIDIISCIEYDEGNDQMIKNNPKYHLTKRFQMDMAWSDIYTLWDTSEIFQ